MKIKLSMMEPDLKNLLLKQAFLLCRLTAQTHSASHPAALRQA
jgi:hypothetical protein